MQAERPLRSKDWGLEIWGVPEMLGAWDSSPWINSHWPEPGGTPLPFAPVAVAGGDLGAGQAGEAWPL